MLSQALIGAYHGKDCETCETVSEQDTEGTSLGQRTTYAQKQPSADGASEGNELNVPRLKPLQESVSGYFPSAIGPKHTLVQHSHIPQQRRGRRTCRQPR